MGLWPSAIQDPPWEAPDFRATGRGTGRGYNCWRSWPFSEGLSCWSCHTTGSPGKMSSAQTCWLAQCQERAGRRACLPSQWKMRKHQQATIGSAVAAVARLQGGLAKGTPVFLSCGMPPLPAHHRHFKADMQTTSCATHELAPCFPCYPGGIFPSRGGGGMQEHLLPWSVVHGEQLPLGRSKHCTSTWFQGKQRDASSSCLTWSMLALCRFACSWGSRNANGLAFCSAETVKRKKGQQEREKEILCNYRATSKAGEKSTWRQC